MEEKRYDIEEIVEEYPMEYQELVKNQLSITEDDIEIFLLSLVF